MSRTVKRIGTGAALCAFGAIMLPAAPAFAAPGDVTVTYFEDRYSDGVFDTSKTSPAGEVDQKRTSGYVYLQDASGAWWATIADANGDFSFSGLPAGEAKVYLGTPDPYVSTAVFDASVAGAPVKLPQTTDVSFETGTYVAPDGATRPIVLPAGRLLAEATIAVGDTEQAASIGMSSLSAGATVVLEGAEGTPVSDLAEITFSNNGSEFDAVEWADGKYYPAEGDAAAHFTAPTIGIEVAPVHGYEVSSVTAEASGELPVVHNGDRYTVATDSIGRYFESADFTVTLAEADGADVSITRFDDRYLDGVFDPSLVTDAGDSDVKRDTGYVYIEDVNGDWWATTADDEGDYNLTHIPTGRATIHLDTPNSYVSEVFWNATNLDHYSDIERGSHESITFDEATYIAPDGSTTPMTKPSPELTGAIEVELVEGEQQLEIGMASVTQGATVVDEAGAPVTDAAELTFRANDETFAATEWQEAAYYADEAGAEAFFSAAVLGITATPAEGYEVVSVEAVSSLFGDTFEITHDADTSWSMTPEQIDRYFDGVEWVVTVAEVVEPEPTPEPTDPGTPGPTGPGAPAGPAAPGTGGSAGDGSLADTGSDGSLTALAAALGVGLLALGALLARRRRIS
ncbi:hypothetical protein GCM10027416_29680 [Okibacterium endophyticum]